MIKTTKAPKDMLSAVDVDKVIREDMPSDANNHWYLSMSASQRMEAAESLSRISHAICGRTKEDIIEHIDDKCVSREYLDSREQEIYMPNLKEAMRKAVTEVSKDVAETLNSHIEDVTEVLKRMSDEVVGVKKDLNEERNRREEDREIIDKHVAELKMQKEQLSSMGSELRILGTMPATLNNVHSSLTALHDTVNLALRNSPKETAKPAVKPSALSKVPWQAWAALAAGVAAALVYIITGDVVNFGAVFGGVK